MRMMFTGSVLLSGALLLASCGASTAGVSTESTYANEFKDAPAWVRTTTCSDPPVKDPEQHVCGVGSHKIRASHLIDLSRRAAGAAASSQIALTLKKRVETLLTTYKAEWVEGATDDAGAAAEGKVQFVDEEWAKMTLPGVRTVDTWISPSDNVYVLQVLDLDGARKALDAARSLSAKQKATIDAHQQDLLERLADKPE